MPRLFLALSTIKSRTRVHRFITTSLFMIKTLEDREKDTSEAEEEMSEIVYNAECVDTSPLVSLTGIT